MQTPGSVPGRPGQLVTPFLSHVFLPLGLKGQGEGAEALMGVIGQELWPRDNAHPTHGNPEERSPSLSVVPFGHRAQRRKDKNGVLILPGMARGLDPTSQKAGGGGLVGTQSPQSSSNRKETSLPYGMGAWGQNKQTQTP